MRGPIAIVCALVIIQKASPGKASGLTALFVWSSGREWLVRVSVQLEGAKFNVLQRFSKPYRVGPNATWITASYAGERERRLQAS